MKIRPLNRNEVRSIDKDAEKIGLSTLLLMENAGRGAADLLRREITPSTRILIVCGTGNNGGDGAVMARHLDAAGYAVRLVWFSFGSETPRYSGLTSINLGILTKNSNVAMENCFHRVSGTKLFSLFAETDWIVDGIFGTGLNRPLEDYALDVIEAMNRSGKPILAIDIPSGLDTDTGQPLGEAVKARLTATFVAPKLGFTQPGAEVYTGQVHVVEIGVPRRLLEPFVLDRL